MMEQREAVKIIADLFGQSTEAEEGSDAAALFRLLMSRPTTTANDDGTFTHEWSKDEPTP